MELGARRTTVSRQAMWKLPGVGAIGCILLLLVCGCGGSRPTSAAGAGTVPKGTMEVWVDPAIDSAFNAAPVGGNAGLILAAYAIPGTPPVTVTRVSSVITRGERQPYTKFQYNVVIFEVKGYSDEFGLHENNLDCRVDVQRIASDLGIDRDDSQPPESSSTLRAVVQFTGIHEIGHGFLGSGHTGIPGNYMCQTISPCLVTLRTKGASACSFTAGQQKKIRSGLGL